MSDTQKHTPGPWHMDTSLHIYGKARELKDSSNWAKRGEEDHVATATNYADARLIAAAPDLLTLALRIKAATDEDWKRPTFIHAVKNAASNLSARAEGRA